MINTISTSSDTPTSFGTYITAFENLKNNISFQKHIPDFSVNPQIKTSEATIGMMDKVVCNKQDVGSYSTCSLLLYIQSPPGELETSSTGACVFVSMCNISKSGFVSDDNVSVLQLWNEIFNIADFHWYLHGWASCTIKCWTCIEVSKCKLYSFFWGGAE